MAESITKETHLNLQRGRGEKNDRQEKSLLRTLLASHNSQSRDEGLLWSFATTAHGAGSWKTAETSTPALTSSDV